ncbi:MAG: BtpA/SgcQ family protein [Myxococcota bacterium]
MLIRPVFPGIGGDVARHALIGMVHLGPLLEKGVALADVERRAVSDAEMLAAAGFDGLVVENFGDTPFYPDEVLPHTIAAMTRMIMAVRRAVGAALPIGVNVLRNDARGALAIAAATGSQAIRVNVHAGAAVTDQGLVMGRAYDTVRQRRALAPEVRIWADVRVKHAAPLAERAIAEEAEELAERAEADVLVVSGAKTGGPTDPARLEQVRRAVHVPILVGSGATPDTLPLLLPHCDGVIVGSWLKHGGDVLTSVDPQRARAFVDAARGSA